MSFLREASGLLSDVAQVADTLIKLHKFEKEEEAAGRPTPDYVPLYKDADLDSMSIGQLVDAIFNETEHFMDSPELAEVMDRYAQKHRLGIYGEIDEAKREAAEWVKTFEPKVEMIMDGDMVVGFKTDLKGMLESAVKPLEQGDAE